jgi:heme/copper-type cytochrome/quinol oxidase subunit 3
VISANLTGTAAAPRRGTGIPNAVFGVVLLLFVELMFFSALFSSYFVIRRGRIEWDIPQTVQLPTLEAGFISIVLVLSVVFLFLAGRDLKQGADKFVQARMNMTRAQVLAALFVVFQGWFAYRLVGAGMTMTNSLFGACFYLIVGAHALHLVAGLLVMTRMSLKIDSSLEVSSLNALQIFWAFLVAVWLVFYVQIYL